MKPVPPSFVPPNSERNLSQEQAQNILSSFLQATATKPYLHPDAMLNASGITFSATSGSEGGLEIHHLKRIEKGLNGEILEKEKVPWAPGAELGAADAGAYIAATAGSPAIGLPKAITAKLPEGDDARLDELAEQFSSSKNRVLVEVEEDTGRRELTKEEKKARKAAKKERRKKEKSEN